MKVSWKGASDLGPMAKVMSETIRVTAARTMMEVAKRQRDRALENFGRFGIRMITGRSRSLYAIAPQTPMFTPGTALNKMIVDVGYNAWPKTDHFSPKDEIPFYPWFLNYGTRKMPARPFHSAAVNATAPEFERDMEKAMDEAIKRASAAFGGTMA